MFSFAKFLTLGALAASAVAVPLAAQKRDDNSSCSVKTILTGLTTQLDPVVGKLS
jgi:hypothetical protein